MAGGPAAEIKNKSVEKDASFNIYETWGSLLKNFIIVAIIAITVWMFVTVLRYSIEYGSNFMFSPFSNLYESKTDSTKIENVVQTNSEFINELVLSPKAIESEESDKQEISSKKNLNNQAYLIFLILIISAFIRALLLKIPSWKTSEGDGMARSLEYYHETYEHEDNSNKPIPRYKKPSILEAIRRLILTSLTVGTGGSGGIEAPVVPIGECIGAFWSKILKIIHTDDLRIYQMAGMAAAVTTLLDAPFTSALFAAEIVYNARILYRPLMYSLIGAIVAFALNNHFLNFEPLFTPTYHAISYSIQEYLEVTIVALICSAPASIGITMLFKKLKKLIKPYPNMLQPIIGAVGTGCIGLGIWFIFGLEPQHVLGVSEDTIIQVMSGEGNPLLKYWWILALLVVCKAFATGFTLMAGGSAGSLVPAMYLGGLSGAAIFNILIAIGYQTQANVAVFVVAGLASALVAVVQVPLAAIAFVMEVFGAVYGPPAIVACVLTYLLARRWKLYVLD